MKTIFYIQDFNFNKKINYHKIAQTVKQQFYLIAYHTSEVELNQYIDKHYTDGIFKQCFALERIDEESIKSIIHDYIKSHDNQIEMVTNSETAISLCGQLRKHFGLDNDDMLRYVDKIMMKQTLSDKVKIPQYLKFCHEKYVSNPDAYWQSLTEKLGLPVFIKPVNQYSSRGTVQINMLDEFKAWYQAYDASQEIEIDEMINGKLYHCDSFIKDGKILYTHVCEYLRPCYDFILGMPTGSYTLDNRSANFIKLAEYNAYVLKQLGLIKAGLTHLEVFVDNSGELIFLEVAARPAGAEVPVVYQKSLNISIREAHLLLQIDPAYHPQFSQTQYAGFVSYPKKSGTVSQLNVPHVESEHMIHWDIKIGDQLTDADKLSDVAVSIVLWNKNLDQLKADLQSLKQFNAFIVRKCL